MANKRRISAGVAFLVSATLAGMLLHSPPSAQAGVGVMGSGTTQERPQSEDPLWQFECRGESVSVSASMSEVGFIRVRVCVANGRCDGHTPTLPEAHFEVKGADPFCVSYLIELPERR